MKKSLTQYFQEFGAFDIIYHKDSTEERFELCVMLSDQQDVLFLRQGEELSGFEKYVTDRIYKKKGFQQWINAATWNKNALGLRVGI
jgi:hypothetical protein